MDGVAHLMRQRGDAVQRAAEVQQDIGVGVIAAAGVRTAALAAVGVNIDPALGKRLADGFGVILAQGSNSLQHHFLRGFVGVALIQIADQRGVDIVEMQLLHAQHLLAQADVAVHRGHMLAHGGNQIVVDLGGNVLPCHGHSAGGFIVAGVCFRHRSLDRTGIGGGKGVDVLAVALVEAAEGILAQNAIVVHLQGNKAGAGDLDILTGGILGGFKHQIGIVKTLVRLGGCLHDLPEAGKQLFLGLAQGMGLAAQQVLQHKFVVGNGGGVDQGVQLFLRQTQQFGLEEGQRSDHLDILAADAGVHTLGVLGAGILVVALGGVAVQALQLALQSGLGIQIGFQRVGIVQLARKGSDSVNVGIQRGKCGFPRGIVGKHGRQIPLVAGIQLAAFF